MAMMKAILMDILECQLCYGKGFLYYGDLDEYEREVCECNPHNFDVSEWY